MNGLGILESPWVNIWFVPRATIRRIVDKDPKYLVILLAALAGGVSMLKSALGAVVTFNWLPGLDLGSALHLLALGPIPEWLVGLDQTLLFLSPFVGAALGIATLYGNGFILKWGGGMLGGTATAAEVRAAIAWAGVPQVCLGVAALAPILEAALFAPTADSGIPAAGLEPAFSVSALILWLWSLIIFLKCLGEVHRFSAWRALASVLLTALLLLPALLFAFLLGAQLYALCEALV
jgi:hypothetical protein